MITEKEMMEDFCTGCALLLYGECVIKKNCTAYQNALERRISEYSRLNAN